MICLRGIDHLLDASMMNSTAAALLKPASDNRPRSLLRIEEIKTVSN